MKMPSATAVPLNAIASCFEGIIPATICSCSREGTPNVTYLSIVHYVDPDHVALSYQFFNKTRANVMENPQVQVVVVSPETRTQYRLDLRYERTETQGTTFDLMKTRLDAVASQTGMSHVFKLRGADVYRALDCRALNSGVRVESTLKADYLLEFERFTERLASCTSVEALIDSALDVLAVIFGYEHLFVMMRSEDGKRLYTLASRGFEASGVGSEVWIGEGILGVAAERRVSIRTTNLTRDVLYFRAVRSIVEHRGGESNLEREIALPGLPDIQSQLVTPLVARNQLIGVLCLQSSAPGRFLHDDERIMQIAARHLAASIAMLRRSDVAQVQATPDRPEVDHPTIGCIVKHYKEDDSIFIDNAYLIKGVAGRIFWRLIQDHVRLDRVDFTNKELRLDASLELPDIKDNLEARLILLRRRLRDRCDFIRLTQAGRGQLHLEVQRRLALEEH